jgi:SAM-dependent methyltransferase
MDGPLHDAHSPRLRGENLGDRLETLNRRMERLGRMFGVRWLAYNPIRFYRWHVYAEDSKRAVVDSIVSAFPDARSFADVGAGTGTYAAELARRGVRVVACEKALFGRMFAFWQRLPSRSFDLSRREPARLPITDVAYCLEVAEHVPPELGDRLVSYLARFPAVLFSAAHPGQGGEDHINEQPKEYWIERFTRERMELDPARTDRILTAFRASDSPWWLIDNAMVFRRASGMRAAEAPSWSGAGLT